MVGAGKAEGAIDAGNMLKPALARGELHCVGATTLDEYRKYVEKDAALERRFQKVLVDEPSVEVDDRDPARPAGALRDPPRRRDHRPGDRRRGGALAPLHHRPLPARQGDRPDRRGRGAHQDGDRLQARGDGPARPPADPAEDRARGGEEGKGRGVEEAARPDRAGDRASSSASTPTSTRCGRPRRRRSPARSTSRKRSTRSSSQMDEARRKGDWQKMSELQYGKLPQLEAQLKKADKKLAKDAGEEAAAAAHAGRRRGNRRGRLARDRHSGVEDDAGRARQAAAHGRRAAQARRRPGRGGAARRRCDPPLALGARPIRIARTARSCSSARPAWARPSSARRSPNSCSTPSSI